MEFLSLTVNYTTRDSITLYYKCDLPKDVNIVTYMYGDKQIESFIEDRIFILEKGLLIKTLADITDPNSSLEEIQSKLPRWTLKPE